MIKWAFEHPWMTFIIICLLIEAVDDVFCTLLGHSGGLSLIRIVNEHKEDKK